MASRSIAAIVCAAVLATAVPVLAAEPTAADRETARALMAEGRDQRDKGDLEGALKAFRGADAIMHVPTTALEVARTEAATGLLVEARDHALTIARSRPTPGEPAPFADARTAADTLAAELEGRIPSLKIKVHSASEGEVEVRLDDAVIPFAALGLARKLDPGSHVIVAKKGADVRRLTVDVGERDGREVTIDFSVAPPATKPDDVTSPPPDRPELPGNPARTALVLGGFGIGLVGVAVGSVTGMMSLSKTSTLKEQCPNDRCPAALEDDLASARTLATVSTIAFVIAGAGIVAGVVGLVALKPHRPAEARIVPWIGVGAAGLSGSF